MASNSKANGLIEAIFSQVTVNTTEGYPKIDLFTFEGHDRELHIGWSYGVGPKVNMRLCWIAYVCTVSDFL